MKANRKENFECLDCGKEFSIETPIVDEPQCPQCNGFDVTSADNDILAMLENF